MAGIPEVEDGDRRRDQVPHAARWIFLKSNELNLVHAGLASLPEIRHHDLVVERQWISDEQLNSSVVITRTTPGPVGVWVVAAGYMADGVPGAIAGWIAMSLPSLVVILLVGYSRQTRRASCACAGCCSVWFSRARRCSCWPRSRSHVMRSNGPLAVGITIVALPLLLAKRSTRFGSSPRRRR